LEEALDLSSDRLLNEFLSLLSGLLTYIVGSALLSYMLTSIFLFSVSAVLLANLEASV
jgi:hypothetical protein